MKRNGIVIRTAGSCIERYRCKKCQVERKVPIVPSEERLTALDKLRERDLLAISLYTQGYPLAVIREQTKVKQQTFRRKLAKIHQANLWSDLEELLQEKFSHVLDEEGLRKLRDEFQKHSRDKQVFRRVGQITAKEFRDCAWEKEDETLHRESQKDSKT